MAKRPSAGDLWHSVAFEKRVVGNPDSPADFGNTVMDWKAQFCCRAAFTHLRGGEAVIAGRLQGRHPMVVQVRAFSASRSVTSEWRMKDQHTGIYYAVRDISPNEDRMFLDILVESGVAA